VDAATIAFISSNSSASNPDVLLQQRLQDALNAKFAAESRAAALTVRVVGVCCPHGRRSHSGRHPSSAIMLSRILLQALADRVEGAFAAAGSAEGGAGTAAVASDVSASAGAAASR